MRDPAHLRGWTFDAAIDLLALGLDPQRAVLFIQSEVPQVSELCWILMTGAPMGLLERCHAYKDKKSRGLPADAGLFTYPVLMSADILAYDADTVPVGFARSSPLIPRRRTCYPSSWRIAHGDIIVNHHHARRVLDHSFNEAFIFLGGGRPA